MGDLSAGVPHDSGVRRSSHESPPHGGLSAGSTPRKATRRNMGSDHSVEQSPLHPHSQGRIGGQVTSSPSWETKVSSDGSHGQATSIPGRSRLRSVNRGDETPDQGPVIPKFGEWDDNDPSSGEGFTQIFNKVQEEKQTAGGRVPIISSESPYTNGHMRDGYNNSKDLSAGVPHDSGVRRSSHESPPHGGLSAGSTPRKATRRNMGSDHSVEQSPLHPHSQGRIGGQVTSSPSWETKVSSDGSHGQATSIPGRSRLRSVNRGDETPDQGPVIPKFGEWDDNDPSSGEGFTQIFNKVQEEKQTAGGRVPIISSESPYTNGHMRDGYNNSKGCCCIPWGRR